MAKTLSGRRVVKVLVRNFGFKVVGQKGSHIKLGKLTLAGKVSTVVPDHKELARGTLKGALRLAKVDEEEFWGHA